jgi:hypothetical protein
VRLLTAAARASAVAFVLAPLSGARARQLNNMLLRHTHPPLHHTTTRRLRVFELFPVLLGILMSWFVAWVCTIAGAYTNAPPPVQAACRTDQSTVLANAPWIR